MFRLRARWPCLETMYKYKPKTRYLPWKYKQNYRKLYGLQISEKMFHASLYSFQNLQLFLNCCVNKETLYFHYIPTRIIFLLKNSFSIYLHIVNQ